MLHCLLSADDDGWAIEAISPEPPLIVNGAGRRFERLSDGDVLEIGPFRFRFSMATSASLPTRHERYPRLVADV